MTVNPSCCTSRKIRSCAPPGSTTIACFVTGSPMIEQLQPRGGTENVFLIMVDIMNACYRPSPSGRKELPAFWFFLILDGPDDFRIKQRPPPFLTAKPYEESRAGAVGT